MARPMYNIEDYLTDYFDDRVSLLRQETDRLRQILLNCGSPLEQQFLIWLSKWFCARPNLWAKELCLEGSVVDLVPESYPVWITQQPVITSGEHRLRADFLVKCFKEDHDNFGWQANPIIQCIIEVDGHDFHERTKEQAEKDKMRDRHYQAKGFKIFRFAGTEVYRDAEAATAEIHSFFISEIERLYPS